MKFNITKIDINTNKDLSKNLVLNFTYYGDNDKDVLVRIFETYFDVGWKVIGNKIHVTNGINYWVSDNVHNGLAYRIVNNIKIEFLDFETNEVIYSEICNIGNDNFKRRSLGGDISKKNVWIIGDSNTYNYFSMYKKDSKDMSINDYIINPIDVPELSINRFVNKDYSSFFDSLPLKSQDKIILILGEIDCRVGFYRNSEVKKNLLIDQITNVIDRYYDSIMELKSKYKDIEIVLSLPNPTLRDGWLKDRDDLTHTSTQKDRLFIRQFYEKYLQKKFTKEIIKILDLTKEFSNELGFIKDEILVFNDTHNKPTNTVFENIKKFLIDD